MMAILIGVDLGTTSIKAVALDLQVGKVIKVAEHPTPVDHPIEGWSQHDPQAFYGVVVKCLQSISGGEKPVGLAISSFGEAGLPLDAHMEPLYPVIAWYDRRCEVQAAGVENMIPPGELHAIAGQRVSTSFALSKWMWISQNYPEICEKTCHWLSVPDYMAWRLTGQLMTERTIASRTLLFDQKSLDWSERLLDLAGLKKSQMPPAFPAGTRVGSILPEVAIETGLPEGMPVFLGGHDHLCAALAAGGWKVGATVDSSGTAQAIIMLQPSFRSDEALTRQGYACYTYLLPGMYVLKGGLKAAGGAIEWLARQLTESKEEDLPYGMLEREGQSGIGKRAGPAWLPHLIASGTPEGDRLSRGALVGLRAEHNRGDLFRGLLESLACYLRHNLEVMSELSGQAPEEVILLGGTTRLKMLSQLKADVTRLPMCVPDLREAAACGAALLAGIGCGVFRNAGDATASLQYEISVIHPDLQRAAWYDQYYAKVYRPLYQALVDTNHSLAEMEVGRDDSGV